jgi:putative addiction module CopG family antidote
MGKTYTPGPEADDIIARQVAKGNFATPDEAVRAGVQLLEAQEAELEELRKRIDEGDAAYARGDYTTYTSADQFLTDIKRLGAQRSRQKP